MKDEQPHDAAVERAVLGAWRAARALGYRRLVTYILAREAGTSLRAAGWLEAGKVRGGTWSRPSREREDGHPLERKVRWEVTCG